MALRFHLHRATSGVTGTLPATNARVSAATPTWTPGVTNSVAVTPLLTNRVMDATVSGVAQTSLAYTTDNVATAQRQPLLRWVSEPIKAQTIPQQYLAFSIGASESAGQSDFTLTWVVAVWRPSNGTLVGRVWDGPTAGSFDTSEPGTSQTVVQSVPSDINTTEVIAQAGDVLVVEAWRSNTVQTMATSYTNTIFYDGRVYQSTTDIDACVDFATNVALASEATYGDVSGTAIGGATNTATIAKISPPVLPLASPADNFVTNTLNTSIWTTWGSGSVVLSASLLQMYSDGVMNHYSGLISNSSFDVTDKTVQVQFDTLPNTAGGNQMYFQVELDGNNALTMGWENGNLFVQDKIAATITTRHSSAWPASTRGLRIVFDNAQNLVWFGSTVNGIAWDTKYSRSIPFATTVMKVVVGAGSYGQANYGVAYFESINCPVAIYKNLNRFIYGGATVTGAPRPDVYGSLVASHPNLVSYWRLNE